MSKKTIIGAFLGGAAIGAATLLIAPKKGSELRADAKETFNNTKEKVQEVINKVRNTEEKEESNTITLESIIREQEETEQETTNDQPSN